MGALGEKREREGKMLLVLALVLSSKCQY